MKIQYSVSIKLLLLALLFILSGNYANAQLKTWSGTNTSWNTAGNWTPAGVPTNTSQVVIPNIANQPTLDISGLTTISSLLIDPGATLSLGAGVTVTFTVSTTATINGTLNFGTITKTVNITGNLSGTGTILMTGAGLTHALNLGGGLNSIGTFTTTPGVASTVTYNGGADQTVFVTPNYRNLVISGGGGIKRLTGTGMCTIGASFAVNPFVTFSMGDAVTPPSLTVTNNTTISTNAIFSFGTVSPKVVTINSPSFTCDGTLSMTGIGLNHSLTLNGTGNSCASLVTDDGSGSTITYSGAAGQSVFQSLMYQNVTTSGTANKTLTGTGPTTIRGNLTVGASNTFNFGTSSGTYTVMGNVISVGGAVNMGSGVPKILQINGDLNISSGGNLVMSNAASNVLRLGGQNNATNSFSTITGNTVIYNGLTGQNIFASPNYQNLTLTGTTGENRVLNASTNVNGTLLFSGDSKLILGTNDLVMGVASSITGGPFSSSRMIITDGANNANGSLIKMGNAPADFFPFTYPLGTGTIYSPIVLTSLTGTPSAGSSIGLKVINDPTCVTGNCAKRFLKAGTVNYTVTGVDFEFQFPPSEIVGNPNLVQINGVNAFGQLINNGLAKYGATGTNPFMGDWKLLSLPTKYYSRQPGPYEDINTWSTISLGGPSCNCLPTPNSTVIIGNTHTVMVGSNTPIDLDSLQIDAGSVFDIDKYGSSISIYKVFRNTGVGGNGTLRISAASPFASFLTMQAGAFNDFLTGPGTGRSTVEYYGNLSYSLPSFLNYQHLMISGTGMKIPIVGSMTIAGDLTVNTGAVFAANAGAPFSYFSVLGNLSGGGTIDLSLGARPHVLDLSGGSNSIGTFIPGSSKVIYSGTGAQTIFSASYWDLEVSGATTKTLLGPGSSSIANNLSLNGGVIDLGNIDLIFSTTATTTGTFSATNNIRTTSNGAVILNLPTTPPFNRTIPVASALHYMPADINLSGYTGTGASYRIRALNGVQPAAPSPSTSLSGYWYISSSGLSNINGTLNFTYQTPQVQGIETEYVSAVYAGAVWTKGTITDVDDALNKITFVKAGATDLSGDYTAFATESITTSAIAPTSYCQGATVNIPFTITGTFTGGNIFTAQLSDAVGSFATPTNIGTLTSTVAGTITTTIPLAQATGTGYRIRVISSTPAVAGTDNGTNLSITAPVITLGTITPTAYCPGTTISIPYTVSCLFGAGNVFTAELSNSSGGFPGISIGTFTSTTSGTITGTIPVATTNGTLYKVRVVANTPVAQSLGSPNLTINIRPTAIVSSPTVTICAGTAGSIGGSGSGPTFQWLENNLPVSNGGNYSGATTLSLLITAPTVAFNGRQYALVTTNAAGCKDTSNSSTTLSVPPAAFITVTNPAATCGTPVDITLPAVTTGSSPGLTLSYWTNSGATISLASPNAVATAGTYYIKGIDGNGCTDIKPVVVNITVAPPVASLGLDQNICATSTALAGNNPAPGTGTWTVISGTGTFVPNANTANATVNSISVGNNIYRWTITGGAPCPTTFDEITISRSATSVGGTILGPSSGCSAGNSGILNLIGSTGSIVQWQSSTDNFSSVITPISNTTNTNSFFSLAVTTSYRVRVQNGVCPIVNSAVHTVTINPNPTVPTTGDETICQGTDIALSGIGSTGGTGIQYTFWNAPTSGTQYVTAGGYTYTNPTLFNNTLPPGTYNYYIQAINSATCISTSRKLSTVTINPSAVPTVSISSDDADNTICSGTIVLFTAIPSNAGGAPLYQWKLNGANISGANGATYSTSTLVNGDAISVEVTSSAICPSPAVITSTPINTIVNPAPMGGPGMTSTGLACVGLPVGVTIIASELNTVYEIYKDGISTGTTGIGTGGNFTITVPGSEFPLAQSYHLTFHASIGGCSIVGSSFTDVSVDPISPAPTVISPVNYCENATATPLTATGSGLLWYTVSTGGTGSATAPTPATTPQGLTSYFVSQNTTGCESPREQIDVVVSPPLTASAGSDIIICEGSSAALSGSASGTPLSVSWTGGAGSYTPNASTFFPSYDHTPGEVGTTIVLTLTVSKPGCANATSNVNVTVNAQPNVSSVTYPSSILCSSAAIQNPTLIGDGGGLYTATPAGLNVNSLSGDINPSFSSTGTYTVQYEIAAAGGCTAVSTTTIVSVTTQPVATSISYASLNVCTTAPVETVTLSGDPGGLYSATPAGLSIDPNTGDIDPFLSAAGTYTIKYEFAASGGCPAVNTTTAMSVAVQPMVTSITYPSSTVCNSIGLQSATLSGDPGGTYSSTPIGLNLDPSTGDIIPASSTVNSYTVTYTIPAANGCGAANVSTSISIIAQPTATSITYPAPTVCSSAATQLVTLAGDIGGTYSSTTGLTIDPSTGDIDPGSSTVGAYNIDYDILAAGGCTAVNVSTSISIIAQPTATSITYPTPTVCSSAATQLVTLAGDLGGTYSSTTGLTIDPSTGDIDPSSSTVGVYNIDYDILAAGGCAAVNVSTSISIIAQPTATSITYPTPTVCSSAATQLVTLAGDLGGTYSSTTGLTIDPSTGDIDPSSSTVGAYNVDYDILAAGGCTAVNVSTSISIIAQPTATSITYPTPTVCSSAATQLVTLAGDLGGTYSSTTGLTIDPSTGDIDPSSSTVGAYNVDYDILAAGGCAAVNVSTSISIIAQPTATSITYPTPTVCSSAAAQLVTLSGDPGGTYSSTTGLTIDPSTGDIDPGSSTVGAYNIDYDILAAGGCAAVNVSTSISIIAQPTATSITYPTPTVCSSAATQLVTLAGDLGGTYSSTTGLTIDPSTGDIDPGSSTVGAYNIDYDILAAGGCAAVNVSTSISIIAQPTATSITYPTPTVCSSAATQLVTLAGDIGGTYSSTTGLTIDPSTGDIDPGSSTVGAYNVDYDILAAGGCTAVNVSTSISIIAQPTATSISYPAPTVCSSAATQLVTLAGDLGGTYSSTTGLTIDPSTGDIDPGSSTVGAYNVDYDILAAGGCTAVNVSTSISIIAQPTATSITYPTPTVCSSAATQLVTLAGDLGGTYSSTTGLTIDPSTGDIDPGSSTVGAYNIDYDILAAGGCTAVNVTTSISIIAQPTATSITYPTPTVCSSAAAQLVTLSGDPGGTYSSTTGLTIDPSTGDIDPGSSTVGAYNIDYDILAAGGCAAVNVTTSISITAQPTATSISYPAPTVCSSAATQLVTLSGDAGGTYSSTTGLIIDPSTGDIDPTSSTVGAYNVDYDILAAGGCAAVNVSTSISIIAQPVATSITYPAPTVCSSAATQLVTLSGDAGGTYSSTTGLIIDPSTGDIDPTSSTVGAYNVDYDILAAGGCAAVNVSTSISIIAQPVATSITYPAPTVCSSAATQLVTLAGDIGGTYSSTIGLTIDPTTGDIDPTSSTSGTYTIDYDIAAGAGCTAVNVNTTLSITTQPTAASITYPSPTVCTSAAIQTVTLSGDIGGTYSAAPLGLSIDPSTGDIDPSSSTNGSYSISYGIPATGGCLAVNVNTSLTVSASLGLSLMITPDKDTLCIGEDATVTIFAPENGVTYSAFNNISTPVGTPVTGDGIATFKTITITNVELNGGSNGISIQASSTGCSAATLAETDTIYKSTITAPVIVSNLPTLCNTNPVIFSVPNTFSTYQWYYGTINAIASASQLINGGSNAETVYQPGFYFIKVFDSYNCSIITAAQYIDYGTAAPSIVQSGHTGTQVDLSCPTSSTNYQWYVENSGGVLKYIQGANAANFRAYFDGTYYLAIKVNNCYLYSAVNTVSGMAGGNVLKQGFFEDDSSIVIPDMAFLEKIEAHPNPNNGIFDVQYLSTSHEGSTVTIYNSVGRPVAFKEHHDRGFVSLSFDLSELTSGVYMIEMIQQETVVRKKIMIQR